METFVVGKPTACLLSGFAIDHLRVTVCLYIVVREANK